MSEYIVTNKATVTEVYRYTSDAPVEWAGMEFATHDHTEAPVINDDGSIEDVVLPRRITKLQFIELLGDVAFASILELTKVSPEVNAWVEKFKLTTPDPDGTSVDLTDPRMISGVTGIGQVLSAQSIVSEDWAAGVLNG